ncbi:MAG: MarR family transcriptional regulator [Bacteroidota bacterium]
MLRDEHSKYFGNYIDRNYRLIRLTFLQAFKKAGADITTEQWVIIQALAQNNGLSQAELATQSFKDAPTVSRIINLLVEKGITTRKRSGDDRRRYQILLTDKGQAIYEQVLPSVLALREQGWQGLSEDDYESFLRIMNQIFANFKQLNEGE